MDDNDVLITTEEMAKLLGVKPNTLEVWRSTGRVRLPFVKIGPRSVRYKKSAGLRFIEENTKVQA